MAGKILETDEKKESKDNVLTFDNNKDYVVIKLKADGKNYVEHKHFADKLVAKKAAEIVKDAKLEEVKSNTQILNS